MRPLVTPFSASYSAKSSGAPTPAVTPGSKATTVAAGGCSLEAIFQSNGTVNAAAINCLKNSDWSGIILQPSPYCSHCPNAVIALNAAIAPTPLPLMRPLTYVGRASASGNAYDTWEGKIPHSSFESCRATSDWRTVG